MSDFKVDKRFVLAGHAIFTVHNGQGTSYTFRVMKAEADGNYQDSWFISLLTGPDNKHDYTYVGKIDPIQARVRLTRQSRYNCDSLPVKVINWVLPKIWQDKPLPEGYGCHGAGYCGRCGIQLTAEPGVNPEGFRYGYGPTCWKKMQGIT